MNNDKFSVKQTIAGILVVCLVIAAILPLPFGGYKKLWARLTEEPIEYTYVLVHGMGGWSENSGMNEVTPYWGTSTGSVSKYLRGEGYLVEEATVGPFSSAWDRFFPTNPRAPVISIFISSRPFSRALPLCSQEKRSFLWSLQEKEALYCSN